MTGDNITTSTCFKRGRREYCEYPYTKNFSGILEKNELPKRHKPLKHTQNEIDILRNCTYITKIELIINRFSTHSLHKKDVHAKKYIKP